MIRFTFWTDHLGRGVEERPVHTRVLSSLTKPNDAFYPLSNISE